ncbi:hypothetical protein SNEBB_004836, partial [Seison nebaliae]
MTLQNIPFDGQPMSLLLLVSAGHTFTHSIEKFNTFQVFFYKNMTSVNSSILNHIPYSSTPNYSFSNGKKDTVFLETSPTTQMWK